MTPIAIIDVDETLWAFHDAVMSTGKELGVKLPIRSECNDWNAIFKYGNVDEVIQVFNKVHSKQCSYKPYPDAEHFLKYMKSRFHVMISSHRLEIYRQELVDWLDMNNLVYDEVHVSNDKTLMFNNPRVAVVIDDRADTIIAALNKHKIGVGLRKPWNEQVSTTPLALFDSLTDIEDYLSNNYENISEV
jgi:hypothetical protein